MYFWRNILSLTLKLLKLVLILLSWINGYLRFLSLLPCLEPRRGRSAMSIINNYVIVDSDRYSLSFCALVSLNLSVTERLVQIFETSAFLLERGCLIWKLREYRRYCIIWERALSHKERLRDLLKGCVGGDSADFKTKVCEYCLMNCWFVRALQGP